MLTINNETTSSEDPRAFLIFDELFLIYNVVFEESKRRIHLAKIDPNTFEVLEKNPLFLKQSLSKLEKNWSPFIGYDEENNPSLMFEYSIYPRKIVQPDPRSHIFVDLYEPKEDPKFCIPWTWKFLSTGSFRGGTPSCEIEEGLCLSFFHFSFTESNCTYYAMGAYTFENKAPFIIRSISPYPIIFQNMYDAPFWMDRLYVIYPAGYVTQTVDGVDLLHVSCGVNDMAIDIVTFDKEKLLKSLAPTNVPFKY